MKDQNWTVFGHSEFIKIIKVNFSFLQSITVIWLTICLLYYLYYQFFTNFVNVRPTNPPFNMGTFLQNSFIREFIQDYWL